MSSLTFFLYGAPEFLTGSTFETGLVQSAVKLMFAAGEKSGDFVIYYFHGIKGNIETGSKEALDIFSQLKFYNIWIFLTWVRSSRSINTILSRKGNNGVKASSNR